MSYQEAARDVETRTPGYLDGYPDERCDGGPHDLYEPATRFTQGYVANGREHINQTCLWCPECRSTFTTNTADHSIEIGSAFWDLTMVQRCDQCGFMRCMCP